jgi:DNA-binding transcriptional LysR family regulator
MLSLEAINVLDAIARNGSFSAAAAALGTAAPDRTGGVTRLGQLSEHLLSPRLSLGRIGLGR